MAFDYVFLIRAQEEYESSVAWYAERSVPAAEQFVIAVEHALSVICQNPYLWRNEYKDFYEVNLRKFPFSIVFTLQESEQLVLVTSLFHHSRNPERKYRK